MPKSIKINIVVKTIIIVAEVGLTNIVMSQLVILINNENIYKIIFLSKE